MGFFLELLLTAFVVLVISFVIAKLVSVAVRFPDEKNLDQKKGVEEVKLDKGLKVVRAKSKKRVKFVDDVVVRNIDHFEVSEEPIKDFQLPANMSENVGIFDKFLEGAMEVQRGEGELVDKESELMLCGEKLVQEYGDGSLMGDVKGADAEGEGSKDIGLLDEASGREFVEEKEEDAKVGEDAVGSGLEGLVFEEEINTEEIGDENGLKLINDDIWSDQHGDAAAGDKVAYNAESLDKELEREDVEEKNEHAATDADKISGGKQDNIHVASGSLEALEVQEKIKGEGFGGEGGMELASDGIANPQNEEGGVVSVNEDDVIGNEEGFSRENEAGKWRDANIGDTATAAAAVYDEDDDWEGVERSELEKVFAKAVNYVEYGGETKDDQLVNLTSDVQMQLYGLHKLALEGPCHEPQPMALKVSARAKWNAWQRLGTMSPEVAMEEYIKILSDADPGWMKHASAGDDKRAAVETGAYGCPDTKLSSLQDPQVNSGVGR